MRFDKYTQKAQAAIMDAQNMAEEQNHTTIDPEHLLLALMRQKGGVVPSLLGRMGTDVPALERSIEQLLASKAKISGGSNQISMNREVNNTLREAESIAANMKDEYVSTEHILLAMVAQAGKVRDVLARFNIDNNSILQALASVRGRQRVTSDNPEVRYEALTKY